MSIMENAQQLMGIAERITTEAIGVNTATAESLDATSSGLAKTQELIESTSQNAAQLLGEGHAATQSVTASAAVVVEKIGDLHGQVEALRQNITALDALVLAHGDAVKTAGQQAMGQ